MIQEDEKYKALRDQLRALPRVKAKTDFESRLMQRIREAETAPVKHTVPHIQHLPEKKSWFAFLFRPAFVPALGLAAVLLIAIVAYFAYYSKLQQNDSALNQQFVSSTNQGDLIIYVKKDGSDYSENYPKEYSAITSGESEKTGDITSPSPVETPSDYFAKPDPSRTMQPDIRNDKVSEEQRIEMQRTVDSERDKGVDVKSERKLDDVIMKKESKSDIRTESKGTLKTDNEPKKKMSDEKKNILIDDKDESTSETNINEQKDEEKAQQKEFGKRISRATKKDSTKNKSDNEAEEKEKTDQK